MQSITRTRKTTKKLILLILCLSIMQNIVSISANAYTPNSKFAFHQPNYNGNFALETLYKHNQTIHSWFNFKITVKGNKVKIAPDGSFSERGYVWGDDYEFKIYDRIGRLKLETKVNWFGNVYNDATRLTNQFANTSIVLGDTIEIKRIYYKNTVRWDIPQEFLYNNATSKQVVYPDNKTQRYYFSEAGFIPQTQNFDVKYGEEKAIKYKIEVAVKNTATQKIETRDLYLNYDSLGNLNFDIDYFGETDGYVWADTIEILAYSQHSRYIQFGNVLIEGVPVVDALEELKSLWKDNVRIGDYFSLSSSKNILKLYDNSRYGISVFSNTGKKTDQGINKINFYLSETGLLEIEF